jgi:hypothetical protein
VVKTAIIQHLELDSKITLSVLCDQIVPPDEPIEGDDKVTRERLRTLVVAFLAEDARRPLLIKLQGQGDSCVEQEQALIDTLLKVTDPLFLINSLSALTREIRGFAQAVSKFGGADASKITRDILVFLPSFNSGRPTTWQRTIASVTCASYGFAQGGPRDEADPREPGAGPRLPRTVRLCVSRKGRVGPCPALALLLHIVSHGENDARATV